MYCPVCGAESTQGLNYCKRCGAGLGLAVGTVEPKASLTRLMAVVSLPTLIGALGIVGLFVTASELGNLIAPPFLVAIIAFGGATVVSVVGVIAWLLLRLSGLPEAAVRPPELSPPVARKHQPAELPPQLIVMPSVTEHTTRNFEPGRNPNEVGREG